MEEGFSKQIHRNSYANVVLRLLVITCGFVLVKLNISYLGATLYGLWVTIASISSWANIGDLGISNGLRNELTKAIAVDDYEKQKGLIKTAIIMLTVLAFAILVILTGITESFFVLGVMDSILRYPMYITNAFFCFSFVLGIGRTIAYSYQYSWLASFAQACTSLMQIIGVLVLKYTAICPNLNVFAFVNGGCIALGNVAILILLFRIVWYKFPNQVRGKFSYAYQKSILNVGVVFFILQLSGLILYSTDNVIINKLFNSVEVTKYNIITTVYTTGSSVFALLLISLWSAVTYAAEKNEFTWINREIIKLKKIWIVFALGVILVSFFFNQIISLWLGNEALYYEADLIAVFAIYSLINSFGSIYVNVANGLGRLKLQLFFGILGALINVPLSIVLASSCNMGILGIKLATLFCCIWVWVLVPYDTSRFIKLKIKTI